MSRIVASAPGKVLICGEYAVLRGAPAIAMAIDRRAVIAVAPGDGQESSLETKGYRDGVRAWSLAGGRVAWPASGGTGMGLFERVLAAGRAPAEPVSICIDTRAFHDPETGRKLGLGSSAAVTVALLAALDPEATGEARYRAALAAHAAFQAGRGSGFDIATSHQGGVVRYTRDAGPEGLDWPAGLQVRFFWCGEPASTRAHIRRAEAGAADTELAAMCESATRVADAWSGGNTADVMKHLRRYTETLLRFDRRGDIGVFARGHRELAERASGFREIVYKPCGAGGGDIGAAMALSTEALEAFADGASTRGIVELDLQLEPQGVCAEEPDQ